MSFTRQIYSVITTPRTAHRHVMGPPGVGSVYCTTDPVEAEAVRAALDKAFRLGAAAVSHTTTDVEQAVDVMLDGKMPHTVLGGRL